MCTTSCYVVAAPMWNWRRTSPKKRSLQQRGISACRPTSPTQPGCTRLRGGRLVDHWRAEARKERKLRLASGGRPNQEAADVADAVVSGDRVMAALAELPASQQAAFVLHHLDGCSSREVAELMGRSVKATESLLARARQNLASTYRGQDHE